MRLHEIPEAMRAIDLMLEDAEGELTPEIEAAMNAVEEELSHKVDWVGTVVAEHTAKAAMYEAEVKRLKGMQHSQEKCAERLKDYLKATLEACGVDRVEGRLHKASVSKAARPRIVWTKDFDKIPTGFRREKVEPDLLAAQEAWDRGMLPEGFVVSFTTSLRIR